MRRTPYLALALLALYYAVCLGRKEDVQVVDVDLADIDRFAEALKDAALKMDMKRYVLLDRVKEKAVHLKRRSWSDFWDMISRIFQPSNDPFYLKRRDSNLQGDDS